MRMRVLAGSLIVLLSVAGAVQAQPVYVVEGDARYHQKDCPLIEGKAAEKMKEMKALETDHVPCEICLREKFHPDKLKKLEARETEKDKRLREKFLKKVHKIKHKVKKPSFPKRKEK